ncbi:Tail protein X, partial [Dysosmobacter welbionis]
RNTYGLSLSARSSCKYLSKAVFTSGTMGSSIVTLVLCWVSRIRSLSKSSSLNVMDEMSPLLIPSRVARSRA